MMEINKMLEKFGKIGQIKQNQIKCVNMGRPSKCPKFDTSKILYLCQKMRKFRKEIYTKIQNLVKIF